MSGSSLHKFMKIIPGQEKAKHLLLNSIENDRLSSAYLFCGPPGLGKFAAAIELVRYLKCESPQTCNRDCHQCRLINKLDHPDLMVVVPLPKAISDSINKTSTVMQQTAANPFSRIKFEKPASIGIDTIREINERIALAEHSPGGRWLIIRDAESMTQEAANAFLKTLEEPPNNAYIVLTSSSPEALLQTIRSRTQPVNFVRLSRKLLREYLISTGMDPDEARKKSIISDGSINRVIELANEDDSQIQALSEELWVNMFSNSDSTALKVVQKLGKNRSLSQDVIKSSISFLRDHMLAITGPENLIQNIDRMDRISKAKNKFSNPIILGKLIQLMENKYSTLNRNPQYDLFWMDLIIKARRIIAGKIIEEIT